MTANPGSSLLARVIISAAIQLLSQCCLCQPPKLSQICPPTLQTALAHYKSKGDLTGWIYAQLEWTGQSAADHAALLTKAVDSAWRRPHTAEESQAWQDLLTNQGYALLLAGDIVPSTDAYTRAFDWARDHPESANEAGVVEHILKPLGNNYTRLGDYEQALFIHQQTLALALSEKDPTAIAGTYSNLANTCSSMGNALQALAYCSKGLLVVKRASALAGLLLSEQADAWFRLDSVAKARHTIDQSIRVLENAQSSEQNTNAGYWLFTAYQQAGDIYADIPGQSLTWYRRALHLQARLLKKHGPVRQRERAKLFQRLSALYASLHQPSSAAYWSDQCLAILLPGKLAARLTTADLYAENTLADLLYTRAGLSIAANAPDEAIGFYTLCFATEKKIRQELSSTSSKQLAMADTRERYEAAIGTAWTSWEKTRNARYEADMLGFMESSKAQLLLEDVLRQQRSSDHLPGDSLAARIHLLQNALAYYRREAIDQDDSSHIGKQSQERQLNWELSQLYKKAGKTQPASLYPKSPDSIFSIGSLPRLFEQGQCGRLFFAGSTFLYTIECTSDGIAFAEQLPLGTAFGDSIRKFVDTWFEHGANPMIDRPQDYCIQAYALYQRLFKARPLLAGKQYLLFPDGALNQLPMEALVTTPDCPASPAAWPCLIRQTQLSYGWSLQTLLVQTSHPLAGTAFSGFFVSSGNRYAPALDAVGKEQKELRQIIRGDQWWVDSQATTTRLRDALEHAAIVHISAHANTRHDHIDIPSLQLHDGPFYLFELQAIQAHPSLVFLNACKTADGELVTGEGVQSMARAFTASGSKAVIAGWWNVNDETAAALSAGFYRRLFQNQDAGKENVASVLRSAKLAWLDDKSIPYLQQLPYFWASLAYSGATAPLDPPARHFVPAGHFAKILRIIGLGSFILTLAAIFWIKRAKNGHQGL